MNCLVTKLKGQVNNSNLPRFNSFSFVGKQTVAYGSTIYPRMIVDATQALTIKDYTANTEDTVPANTHTSKILTDAHSYGVSSKYTPLDAIEFQAISGSFSEFSDMDITTMSIKYSQMAGLFSELPVSIQSVTTNLVTMETDVPADLSHLVNLKSIHTEGTTPKIKVESLKGLPMTTLYCTGVDNHLYGDIKDLPNTLTTIETTYATGLFGAVADLARLTNCTSFKVKNCPIIGTLEELIAALTGQVSGSIVFNFYGTQVTYQGNAWVSNSDVTITF